MKINDRMLAFAAMGVMGLFLIPSVSAQSPEVFFNSAASDTQIPAVKPEIETQTVTLAFTYNLPNPVFSLGGVQKSSASATIDINCPNSNIIISGPQTVAVLIDPAANPGGSSFPFEGEFQIGVTRDLPGLKQFQCDYSASVSEVFNTAIPPTTGGQGSFTVIADYFPLVQAVTTQQIKQAGPQKDVPFEVQLTNFGNARTQIQFQIENQPEGGRWVAAVPDDVILFSPANPLGATEQTAIFTVTTTYKNGWNNEQGAYRLRMNTFAADDPTKSGINLGTNIIVRVRGVYVPFLEPVVLVGAVLGSALLVRLRRDDFE